MKFFLNIALVTTTIATVSMFQNTQVKNNSIETLNRHKIIEMDFNHNNAKNNVTEKIYTPIAGAGKFISSEKGRAYQPNSSYLEIPAADMGITENDEYITVSMDYNTQGEDKWQMLFAWGEYDLYYSANRLGFNTGNGDIYGIEYIPTKEPIHITAVFNKTNLSKNKLYIDGKPQKLRHLVAGTSIAQPQSPFTRYALRIGNWEGAQDSHTIDDDTSIDNIMVFKKNIMDNEASDLFASRNIPELVGINENGTAKLTWATEILESDVLWRYDYELGEQPGIQLVYQDMNGKGAGGQTFASNESYRGDWSLRTPKTTPDKGNYTFYNTPDDGKSASRNHVYYTGKKVALENGTKVSASFRVKSDGPVNIGYFSDWKYVDKFSYYDSVYLEDYPIGARTLKVSNISNFKSGNHVTADSDPKIHKSNSSIQSMDLLNNTITLATGIKEPIKRGDKVKRRADSTMFVFPTATTLGTSEWELMNVNGVVGDSEYINWKDNPVMLRHHWENNSNEAYIDDLKIGHATKVRLFRGSAKIYEGYASEYKDNDALDRAVPCTIEETEIRLEMKREDVEVNKRVLSIKFPEVVDKGTQYDYRVQGVSKVGETLLSDVKTVDVVSGIKGYSYVIDKNKGTIPDNTVDITTNMLDFKIPDEATYYLHIKPIDNAGNTGQVSHVLLDIPSLEVSPDLKDNSIELDWSMKDEKDIFFKIFQKKPGDAEYQSVSATDVSSTSKVNVLNIYPTKSGSDEIPNQTFVTWDGENVTIPKSASLKRWMEEPNNEHPKGFGMGIIEVSPVAVDVFNTNYESVMKNTDGTWKYDVVMLGSYDGSANFNPIISDGAVDLIGEFIDDGKGFLAGHDTIGYTMGTKKGLGRIREKFNIKVGKWKPSDAVPDEGHGYFGGFVSDRTILKRKGLLTSYPWDLGEEGTQFKVPRSHSTSNFAYGDIWMTYPEGDLWEGTDIPKELYPQSNFYLTTWNNTAMIQTGHSNGAATSDEIKILANTCFYLNQVVTDSYLIDNSGKDISMPLKPAVTHENVNGQTRIRSSKGMDEGSVYEYYVEAESKDKKKKVYSSVKKISIKSGFAGFSYVLDEKPNTIPDNSIEVRGVDFDILTSQSEKDRYIHIKGLDNVGNASETVHYKIEGITLPSPEKPVVEVPENNTLFTENEKPFIRWRDSLNGDILNNDLKQVSAIVNVVELNNGVEYSKTIDGSANSVVLDSLPKGKYSVRVTVFNKYGKAATSDEIGIRVDEYTKEGVVETKDIVPENRIKYLRIETEYGVPKGTSIDGDIYYATKVKDDYTQNKKIPFVLSSEKMVDIIRLPEKVEKLKLKYTMKNMTMPVDTTITPFLDEIRISAK